MPDLAALAAGWYDVNARELPWRAPDTSPWGVLVSEFMLQQTPVPRVLPVWREWLDRWPTPAALAAEPAREAIRAWGRLGYPRRALRLPGPRRWRPGPSAATGAGTAGAGGATPAPAPSRRRQTYAGTDRQVRGLLLAVLRESTGPVPASRLDTVWPDATQRDRALSGLLADGLICEHDHTRYVLPGTRTGSPEVVPGR